MRLELNFHFFSTWVSLKRSIQYTPCALQCHSLVIAFFRMHDLHIQNSCIEILVFESLVSYIKKTWGSYFIFFFLIPFSHKKGKESLKGAQWSLLSLHLWFIWIKFCTMCCMSVKLTVCSIAHSTLSDPTSYLFSHLHLWVTEVWLDHNLGLVLWYRLRSYLLLVSLGQLDLLLVSVGPPGPCSSGK